MNKRLNWFCMVSPALVSLFTLACSDDSSDDTEQVDTSDEEQNDASVDPSSLEPDAGPATGTTSASTNSGSNATLASSSNSASGSSSSNGLDAGAGSVDASGEETNTTAESQATDDDVSSVTGASSDDTNTSGETLTSDVSAELDAGVDASVIEDPTSEETPETTGLYWAQTYWQGHLEPVGETTVLSIEDGHLCFSGDESGTVGFWYNVKQAEGEDPEPFIAASNVGGVNVILETPGEYEMHFYANDMLYCSGLVNNGLTYFLWDSFKECADLFSSYDPDTSFTSVRFTYNASGEFEVCLSQFESGKTDAGVPLIVDGSVAVDGSVEVDASVD